ncbi:MAG: FAD-dependent oxidoreductase [Hyphomicrobiales bacterium]
MAADKDSNLMMKIAIIGAGLSGLTVANQLNQHADVTVFEKSRGTSGRLSTRRSEPFIFDHGAQFFTVKTAAFKSYIAPMIEAGIVAPWNARFVQITGGDVSKHQEWDEASPHYVGVPGMNAVGKHLSNGLNIQLGTHVGSLIKVGDQWEIRDQDDVSLGHYDWVISAIPAQQATALLPSSASFYSDVQKIKLQGCYSLMLGFNDVLDFKYDAALVHDEVISWISINSSKPGKSGGTSLLIHSTNDWADAHSEDNRDDVMRLLHEKTVSIIGHDVQSPDHMALHQWRYANAKKQKNGSHFIDKAQRIGVCGDWCIQGRVEAAFISGQNLANDILS